MSSWPAWEHLSPLVVSCSARYPLPALGVLTRAGVSASAICLVAPCGLGPPGRTISSSAVQPARIDSNSQGEDSTSNASGLCPVCTMRQTARDGDSRTPPPCCLQHGVRYGRYGWPPCDKQPRAGDPRPNFGSGVTTPHLAPWAIVLWRNLQGVPRTFRKPTPKLGPTKIAALQTNSANCSQRRLTWLEGNSGQASETSPCVSSQTGGPH